MDEYIISYITINKNECFGLKKTLKSLSVLADSSDIELIGVDGGSSDGSETTMAEFYGNRLLKDDGRGIYEAMNLGGAFASGRYLVWINAGDEFCSEALEQIRSSLESSPTVLATGIELVDPRSGSTTEWLPTKKSLPSSTIPHAGAYVKREFFEGLGGYSHQYRIAADREFFVRAYEQGAEIKYENYITARQYLGGVSCTHESHIESLRISRQYGQISNLRYLARLTEAKIRSVLGR